MEQAGAPLKKALRELAGAAHENALRRALRPLGDAVARWERGELSSVALGELIHEFHQGPARQLWVTYHRAALEISVAQAILDGLLDRQAIPPDVLEALGRALAFCESKNRETVEA
jgi:hypothetical protein